jgi:uncharacterized protein
MSVRVMNGLLPGSMLVFALFAACQRTDNMAAVEPTGRAAAAATPAPAPSQPVTTPRCLVPLAEPPATAAKAAATCPAAPSIAVPLTRGKVKFLGGTQATIEVELALTPNDQQRGLMYRTELGPDSGMLFSWSNETIHTFWMRDTCIPLDMLFITADGTIAGILEQVPVLNDEPRSIPCPTAHVLEVNAGYCRKNGIVPGQRVRIRTS